MDGKDHKPIPLPRSRSPFTQQQNGYSNQAIKKPVPLPRSSAMPMASSRPQTEEDKVSSESSSFEDVIAKSYNTLTKSLKHKLKTASDNVQEKGKTVIQTTKSVRGFLQKRQSAFTHPECRDEVDDVQPRINRCQSLPTQDIFSSIKFDSPIDQASAESTLSDSDEENSFPPPEYPPPPLPDESLYDELSTRSSISESQGEYYTCASLRSSLPDIDIFHSEAYENVPDLKRLSICGKSDSNSSQSCELSNECKLRNHNFCSSDCGSPRSCDDQSNTQKKVSISRSESWSFYDTVHVPVKPKGEQYVNVTINEETGRVSLPDKNTLASEPKPLKPMQPISVLESICDSSDDKVSFERQNSEASSISSKLSSMSIPNELYINWHPLKREEDFYKKDGSLTRNKNSFATKSFFSEFDPLYESVAPDSKKVTVSSFESLPLYVTEKENSNEDFDTVSLPVPPRRYDSITENSVVNIPNDVDYVLYQRPIGALPVDNEIIDPDSNESSVTTTAENSPSESPEREIMSGKRKTNLVRWTSMKRAIKKVADGSNWSPGAVRRMVRSKTGEDPTPVAKEKDDPTPEMVERPVINSSSGPLHSGFLFKSPSGGEKQKDFIQKWCQLSEGRLTFSAERNSSNKDVILVEHIYSIQIVRETKQSESENVYCMEISCSMRDRPQLVGSPGTTERRIWMQKLLESLTLAFPSRLTTEYTRAGWCYFREGISSGWVAAWILLHKRTFHYCSSDGKLSEIDLRKTRCVVLQEGDEEGCVRVAEKGPLIRLDTPWCAYYLQMNESRETRAWCRAVHEAAVDNGPLLHEQQLSKDDLPTIIEKCINFVYAHGSMSEGIYRRSGSNTSVSKLLTAFQKDAWAVQISRSDYTEHDVASVIKRFFRDLREPLLTTQLHKMLCNASGLECSEEEKVAMYRSLLEQLPPVNYVTTRRLMGHLHHIHQLCERNLMPVDNLAAVWGPTLMHVESGVDANWSRRESEVVRDLILLYPQLFHVDNAELAREQRIQEVLERYHNSNMTTPPSGDIKVWIYIGAKDRDCVSVTVSPHREALDVCNELCARMNVYGHELCLLESVLHGALIRPLHHTERVLDTILRWGYWDDMDCRDNCLILVINTIVRDVCHFAKPPVAQCGELRFADLKSKGFKLYHFEFSQAKLCYYKDKAGSTKLGEWNIEDIVWYIGHEPKRNPHTRWSITFINKNNRSKRSKENPYFGYTIAGTTKDQQLRWMAAMMIGEFPHVDLLPKPQLNLLG